MRLQEGGMGGIGKGVYILLIGIYLDGFPLVGVNRSSPSSRPAGMRVQIESGVSDTLRREGRLLVPTGRIAGSLLPSTDRSQGIA